MVLEPRDGPRLDPGAVEEFLREPQPAAPTDDDRLLAAFAGPFLADAPVANAHDAVRDQRGLGVVADDHGRAPLRTRQLRDRVVDEQRVRVIELAGRLVREEELR